MSKISSDMSSECGTAGLEPVLAAGLNTLIPKLYREFIEQNCRQAFLGRLLLVSSFSLSQSVVLNICLLLLPFVFRKCSRKEVFQPHLPVRLPCYDLAPITSFALGRSSTVTYFRHPRLSWLDGRCVQGPGTYSPRHG